MNPARNEATHRLVPSSLKSRRGTQVSSINRIAAAKRWLVWSPPSSIGVKPWNTYYARCWFLADEYAWSSLCIDKPRVFANSKETRDAWPSWWTAWEEEEEEEASIESFSIPASGRARRIFLRFLSMRDEKSDDSMIFKQFSRDLRWFWDVIQRFVKFCEEFEIEFRDIILYLYFSELAIDIIRKNFVTSYRFKLFSDRKNYG